MAVSHQLWVSGRTHGPHCWENRGPGQSGPGHLSSLPRGRWVWCGYCPGCSPPPPPCLLLSGRLTVMQSEVWEPDRQMSWLKTNCPLCFWPFWVHNASWLSNKCALRVTVVWLSMCSCWCDPNTCKIFLLLAALSKPLPGPFNAWSFLFIDSLTLPQNLSIILLKISSYKLKHVLTQVSLSDRWSCAGILFPIGL